MMSGLSGAFRSFLRRTPVEQFMIASIFLVAGSFVLGFIPSMAGVARWASLLSILFFVLALALSVAARRDMAPMHRNAGATATWGTGRPTGRRSRRRSGSACAPGGGGGASAGSSPRVRPRPQKLAGSASPACPAHASLDRGARRRLSRFEKVRVDPCRPPSSQRHLAPTTPGP
jgi:hypothetical protein